jgi:hypothetical protein
MSTNQPHQAVPKNLLPRRPVAYSGDMEARVAVLEEIARNTKEALGRMEARFDRLDSKIDNVRDKQERDFRFVFGALITAALGLAAMMAHGFHWF